jgi:hypothetical protein
MRRIGPFAYNVIKCDKNSVGMSVRVIYQVCKVYFTGLQVEYQEILSFNLLYLKINIGDYGVL